MWNQTDRRRTVPKGISAIALSQTQPDQTHCSLLENQMRRQSVWRVQDKPHICCVRKVFQNFQLSSLLLSTQRSPMLTNPTPKRPVRDACTHKIDDFSEKPQGEGESQFLSIENIIFREGLKKRPVICLHKCKQILDFINVFVFTLCHFSRLN